jgi:hypothetical protein
MFDFAQNCPYRETISSYCLLDNVYITAGALWPSGGSWNPVLTVVAMTMYLADTIYQS